MGKKNLEEIDKLASEGKLNPHIHKTYSLDNTVDALNELRNRTVIGKVCIKPN
jgi:D-arabinose 1-dehydrogenase-like Zn-dependent alcohol dehydrogenase